MVYFYTERVSYEARHIMNNFIRKPSESLVKAYQRYHALLDNYPRRNCPSCLVLHFFYGELDDQSRGEVDLASRGHLWTIVLLKLG